MKGFFYSPLRLIVVAIDIVGSSHFMTLRFSQASPRVSCMRTYGLIKGLTKFVLTTSSGAAHDLHGSLVGYILNERLFTFTYFGKRSTHSLSAPDGIRAQRLDMATPVHFHEG